jgi:hypothetical protein
MIRVSVISVLALLSAVVPSVVQAQTFVVPSCVDPVVMSGSSYGPAGPCVKTVPVPPTDVPAWLRPAPVIPPVPQPVPPLPTFVAPVYTLPMPVAPIALARGIDPWIPLAGRPATMPSPLNDPLTQLLLLQYFATASSRPVPPVAPVPAPVTPVPPTGDGWMSGFIKGVK